MKCVVLRSQEFVEQKTNGRVRLGPGTLYTLLGKFQDEHLIEETQTDGRKRSYRLTERGRAVFKDELARLKACALTERRNFYEQDCDPYNTSWRF